MSPPQVDAALAGVGIALLPEDELMPHVEASRLIRVLEDCNTDFGVLPTPRWLRAVSRPIRYPEL
jgi:DNA-binding transcriptional LysR family regulator